MVNMMKKNISPIISAEVILKTKNGESIGRSDVPITTKNIDEFTPSKETIKKAEQLLQELGFKVKLSTTTLTILGKSEQFEKIFKVTLKLTRNKSTGDIIVNPESELVIPNSLKYIVDKVIFSEPPEYFL
jgi:subtilase family serine protease